MAIPTAMVVINADILHQSQWSRQAQLQAIQLTSTPASSADATASINSHGAIIHGIACTKHAAIGRKRRNRCPKIDQRSRYWPPLRCSCSPSLESLLPFHIAAAQPPTIKTTAKTGVIPPADRSVNENQAMKGRPMVRTPAGSEAGLAHPSQHIARTRKCRPKLRRTDGWKRNSIVQPHAIKLANARSAT